ncbi:hypothetical protein MRB53_016178 [Persea americana]|uniref:Uncharacterized protein n=1 Tax=Persea americana TaxID=3435 RepID=A0ACC2M1L2_PERAE|nr:hypothetical protein MRB53_016178 [Persea americana]
MERRTPISHWPIPPGIQLLFLSIGAAKGYSSDSFKMEFAKSYWFLSYFCSVMKVDLLSGGKECGCPRVLLLIDDLLSVPVGIEGRYISLKRVRGKESLVTFQIDASMDLALPEMTKQIFPICENFLAINQFVESRSHFKNGLVNHAFAIRALLLDYQAMVAQLEHQFRLGRLSIQGLWFYCQPIVGPMHALSTVIEEASASNLMGSGVLNLLQSQGDFLVHFMDIAGDELVNSPDDTSVEKLQSLLELALCMTAAAADPCHENLTCCVEMSSSLNRLGTLRDLDYGMKNLVTLLKLRTHIQIVVIRLIL